MSSKIRVQRVSEEGSILDEGFLDLENLKFYSTQVILVPNKINLNCPRCSNKVCDCKKPIV